MASVIYNGSKIIPAPLVNISKEYTRFGDNAKLGVNFIITLTGKIFACKGGLWTDTGYPPDTISTDKFQDVFTKINALKTLFELEGKTFEIQTDSGNTPLRCFPTVRSMNFPEDIWVDYADYTIILEAPFIFGLNSELDDDNNLIYLNEASEEWVLELTNESQNDVNHHVFNLQHTLNAVGKQVYTSDGLISNGFNEAKKWVGDKLGVNTTFLYSTSGLNLSNDYNTYNHIVNENSDQYNGKYSINETWIVSKTNTTETFNITTKTSNDNALSMVSIEGSINGLETNNKDVITSSKWAAASGYWSNISSSLFTRAQTYSNVSTLNSIPLNTNLVESPVEGRIQYSYEYDNRPSNCIASATYENIIIHDVNPADIFASIPIIGRLTGPILQNMNTITSRSRSVNIEVIVPVLSTCDVATMIANSPKAEIDVLVASFKNNLSLTYNQVFTNKDDEDWSPKTGRYSRQIEWVIQSCT